MGPTAGHASGGAIAIMPVAMHGQQEQANQKAEPEHAASLNIALTIMPAMVPPLMWLDPSYIDIPISSARDRRDMSRVLTAHAGQSAPRS